jgi:hypothetical protein
MVLILSTAAYSAHHSRGYVVSTRTEFIACQGAQKSNSNLSFGDSGSIWWTKHRLSSSFINKMSDLSGAETRTVLQFYCALSVLIQQSGNDRLCAFRQRHSRQKHRATLRRITPLRSCLSGHVTVVSSRSFNNRWLRSWMLPLDWRLIIFPLSRHKSLAPCGVLGAIFCVQQPLFKAHDTVPRARFLQWQCSCHNLRDLLSTFLQWNDTATYKWKFVRICAKNVFLWMRRVYLPPQTPYFHL